MIRYEEILSQKDKLEIDDIIKISKELVLNEYKDKPWKILNHGVDLLTTEEELVSYMASYGEMHKIKCYASAQNFPFDELNGVVEIVDWGCGQGIASLCFVQALKERKKYDLIKKITLIEPSKQALQRAVFNIDLYTKKRYRIQAYNEYLPSKDNILGDIEQLSFEKPITIHLFSNILDVVSVDLVNLFHLILKASKRKKHFILCTGPTNKNSIRIDEFSKLFNPISLFSDIYNSDFGYTSDTYKKFTCHTKCFEVELDKLQIDNDFVRELEQKTFSEKDTYSDYDDRIELYGVDEEWKSFYMEIKNWLKIDDSLFIKPDINGDIIDMVVVRPNAGILLISCIKEDIKEDIEEDIEENLKKIIDPIRDNLVNMYLSGFKERTILDKNTHEIIKKVLFLCKNTSKEINQLFKNEKDRNYNYIYGYDFTTNPLDVLLKENNLFTKEIYDNFINLLGVNWHTYKEGIDINLTREQRDLSKSNKSQKIGGIAGCGKTQVLALRAVNAQVKTGNKVLILLFNLTLVNYIKARLNQVRADFYWNKFYITSYHQFFKTQANNCNRKVKSLSAFSDESYFEEVKDKLPKFSTILIDEVQDYEQPWLRIIHKYFLEEGGELVVFGDAKQNVYGKVLDEKKKIIVPSITGNWNRSLNKGFRFSNSRLKDLAIEFQKEFFKEYSIDEAIAGLTEMDFDGTIKYFNTHIASATLAEQIYKICNKYKLEEKDFVILAPTCKTLRSIDYYCRNHLKKEVLTTFETQEVYDKLIKLCRGNEKYFGVKYKRSEETKK